MVGKTISHYRILEKLGEGGMGVVYKAEDTKLKRNVALKFLPTNLTTDLEAKERFIQEAQAASALDHPNICTIYEINETEDGQMFIAMAYYGGETLKQKVASKQLSVNRAIDIASQIGNGLAKAHQHGIFHRDIKPANIIITNDELVKIIDFGLVKLAGQARLTKTGTTIGTVAYMSPEQVRGEDIDHRTDIWSLGVVLYEMVTGKLPFGGDYDQAMLYSIVHENPKPMAEYVPAIAEHLQHIVDKALEKDRNTRYQQVDDFRSDLIQEEKSTAKRAKPITSKSQIHKQKILRLSALLMVLALVALVLYSIFNWHPSKHIDQVHKQVTFTGDANYPAISPDGQFVAYVTKSKEAGQQIVVQDIVGGQPLNVYHANSCSYLRWSPDGSELLFWMSDSGVSQAALVPRLGGDSRKINASYFLSWSPDGSQIASSASNSKYIQITNKITGEPIALHLSGSFTWLSCIDWSPLGKYLMYLTQDLKRFTIWTIKIDGSMQRKVVEDSLELSSPRWSADGKAIYYLRSEGQTKNLMRIDVDPVSSKTRGRASTVLTGFPFGDYFTITMDNKRLLYNRVLTSRNLWLCTIKGGDKRSYIETKQLTTGTSWAYRPAISPDGKRVVFSIGKPPQANLFVMPIEGGQMQQLTFLNSYNADAAWSPDGKEIAFGSTQDEIPRVWRINSGGGSPQPFRQSELSNGFHLTWSPGSNILYQRPGNQNFYFLNPETEKEQPLLEKTTGWIFHPRFSPDAKSVVLSWNRSPGYGIWIISLENRTQKLLHGGSFVAIKWSSDRNWIYAWDIFKKRPEIIKVSVHDGQVQTYVILPFDDIGEPDVIDMSPDEKQLVCPVTKKESDVWLVENFDVEHQLDKPIAVPNLLEMRQLIFLQKGMGFFRQKKYLEAENVFREGLKIKQKYFALLNGLGQSLQKQHKYQEAEETFHKALAINPEHEAVLDAYCRATFFNRNLKAAKLYNEKLAAGFYDRFWKVSALVNLAAIAIVQKDYTLAGNHLHKALAIDSTSADAYRQLGYLFAEQHRYSEAMTFAEKALVMDSSFASYNLFSWLLIAGELDIDRSILFAEKTLSTKPEDWQQTAEAYSYYAIPEYTLGLAYQKKGEYNKAISYLEQAAAFAATRQTIKDALQLAKQK